MIADCKPPLTRILKGNLAPGGSVAKITGKEGLKFSGKCRAFDQESDFVEAIESGSIKKGEKTVAVLRYLGPKGGPGEYYWLFRGLLGRNIAHRSW